MWKFIVFLIGAVHAQSAPPSVSYLIYSTQALCLQRSQQMCQAMGCDGINVKYWWDCSTRLSGGLVGPAPVVSGSYAMRIQSGTAFDVTAQSMQSGGVQGLTASEQSKTVPAASIQPLVAVP